MTQEWSSSYTEAVSVSRTPADYEYTPTPTPAATPTATPIERAQSVHQFIVELSVDLCSNEHVGLTGDSKALGDWQVDHCIALRPAGFRKWSTSAVVASYRSISYRYFIYVMDRQGRKQIRRWETQLRPRTLLPADAGERIDRFGVHGGGKGAASQVNRGWLTKERIIQLKLEREQLFQIYDTDAFDTEQLRIEIVPISDDLMSRLDYAAAGVSIEVVKFEYGKSRLQPQEPFGVRYRRGDIVIFHVTVPEDFSTSWSLLFHGLDNKPIGHAFIRADQLCGSEGILDLSISEYNKHRSREMAAPKVIALLTLPYLIVKPFSNIELDFRTTYAHYWPKSWPVLDVGHRGNGRSYADYPPAERENTLASFRSAYEKYADMIELDVHLTADFVPVIYHAFGVRTAPHGRLISRPDQLEYVLIKDVTYEQLKALRVFTVIDNAAVELASHNAEPRREHRVFPTIFEVFEDCPRSLGVNIEIKWPQLLESGEMESHQTMDKNFFVDRILAAILPYAGGRPMLLSSFDADICTMLRFKQNQLPTMFLTMGRSLIWPTYMDLRAQAFVHGINMAQTFELIGIGPHADDFLGDNAGALMQLAHNMGQITLVWGNACNSIDRIRYFGELGVAAICYDRLDLHMPNEKRSVYFDKTTLWEEFGWHEQ